MQNSDTGSRNDRHWGSRLRLKLEDGEVSILTPQQAIKRAQELVSQYVEQGRSLVDELIADRKLDQV